MAVTLVLVNAVLYFLRFKPALLVTGLILILGTFNLLSFTAAIMTFGITIFGIASPGIQWLSLILLIAYCAVNFQILVGWYLDMKGIKEEG
jgi:hypothetical protein